MARSPSNADLSALPAVSAADARRLLLHAQGLLDDPGAASRATARGVAKLVERIGFVQVDTISTVERAHHLILAARLNAYQPALLARALERDRALFEHWTHDASIIPMRWYAHWRPRFERYQSGAWHRKQMGQHAERLMAAVLERVRRDGPLASRDFEHDGSKAGTWWGWRPHKVALDYLWRTGVLHVVARRNFQKVYDLAERAVPGHAAIAVPGEADHVGWACRTALERLGTATPREVQQFWAAVTLPQVNAWLAGAVAAGEAVPVRVESADGSPPRLAYAPADYRKRIARLPDAPSGMRLLSPFDPVLRDRARAKRLFDFDFRFEGFVPAAKRTHGYYVMPVLAGDRLVAKADPKFDRATGTLHVRDVRWEPTVRPTGKRTAAFEAGVDRLAGWIGASRIEIDNASR